MAPEISEVWLFGSLARGQAVPGSDADVLLILEECKLPFLERAAYYQPEFCGVGVDLFAYTRKELEHMERAGHQFLERVKSERICLFKRKKGLEVLKSSQLILRYHPSALGMKPSRVWLCGNHTYQIPENDSKGSSKISALR